MPEGGEVVHGKGSLISKMPATTGSARRHRKLPAMHRQDCAAAT
jgi:hypothetical protein